MGVTLRVPEAGGGQRTYTDERELSIGRDPDQVTVALKNAYVSRYHCVIRRRINGDWVLIHRGRNPSRIGDIVLRKPGEQALLPAQTQLRVGGVSLRLEIDEVGTDTQEVLQIEDLDIRDPESGWWDLSSASLDYDEEDDERTILDEEIPELDDASPRGGDIAEGPSPHDDPGTSSLDSNEIDPNVRDRAETLPHLPALPIDVAESQPAVARNAPPSGGADERREEQRPPLPHRRNDQADIVIFEGGRIPDQAAEDASADDTGRDEADSTAEGFWRRLWSRMKRWFG